MRVTALISDEEDRRRRELEELRRRQRLHFAENSRWPRLDLADLRFERYWIVHTPTSTRYRIVRGEVVDSQFTPATAWFIRDGQPVFLEPVR